MDCNFLRRKAEPANELKGIKCPQGQQNSRSVRCTKLGALRVTTVKREVRKRKLNRKRRLPFSFLHEFAVLVTKSFFCEP